MTKSGVQFHDEYSAYERHTRKSQQAFLAIFLFVMAIFFLLTWRQERQAQDLRTNTYKMCLARNVNLDRLNKFNMGMVAIEKQNPFAKISPETVQRRITLYTQAVLTPIDCENLK